MLHQGVYYSLMDLNLKPVEFIHQSRGVDAQVMILCREHNDVLVAFHQRRFELPPENCHKAVMRRLVHPGMDLMADPLSRVTIQVLLLDVLGVAEKHVL